MALNGGYFFLLLQVFSQMSGTLSAGCYNDVTFKAGDKVRSFSSNVGSRYDNNIECVYRISTNWENYYGIFIHWTSFDVVGDMPYCKDGDYVEILSGCGDTPNSMGKFCSSNSHKPHDIYTQVGCVAIKFHTNSEATGEGFKFTYKRFSLNTILAPNIWCPTSPDRRDGSSGIIYSPNWPSAYHANLNCVWEIYLGKEKHAKITFMFFDLSQAIPCQDYLVVTGGKTGTILKDSSLIKRNTCGKQVPFSIFTDYQKVFIQFKTGKALQFENKGFVAGYVLYSSGEAESSSNYAGTIAGVVVGVLVLIGIVVVVIYTLRRRRAAERASAQSQLQQNVAPSSTPSGSTATGTSSEPSSYGAGYAPKPSYTAPPQYSSSSQPGPLRQPSFTNYPPQPKGRFPPSPAGRPGGDPPESEDPHIYPQVARATVPAGVRMHVLAEEYAPPPYQLGKAGVNPVRSPLTSSNSSQARSHSGSEESFTEETSNKSL